MATDYLSMTIWTFLDTHLDRHPNGFLFCFVVTCITLVACAGALRSRR